MKGSETEATFAITFHQAQGRYARGALRGLALLLLLALGGAAYPAYELLDTHTVALYDFRTADARALADLCEQGELISDGEAPPALAPGAGVVLDGQTRLQGPLAPLTTPFTIEALVRLDGPSPGMMHGLFEQFSYHINGCRMGINPSDGNRVHFELSDPKRNTEVYVSGRTPLEQGKWYHVAATYDGQTERVWVNGKEDGAKAWTGGLVPGPSGMTVGYVSGLKYFFVGTIAYLRISNIARTSFPHGENPSVPPAAPLLALSAHYPDVSAYFFPAGQAFPVTCSVSNATDLKQQYKLRLEVSLLGGGSTTISPVTLKVPPHAQGEAVIPVKLTTRGMYLASLVAECAGVDAWRQVLPSFAIVEPLPPLAQVPASSHFGGQPLYCMPGSERVGMKWNRFLDYTTSWYKMEPERGQFNWEPTDKLLSDALAKGEQVLWCLGFTPGWASSIPDRATVLADPVMKGMYGAQLESLYDSGNLTRQYPPRDLADWRRYVTAMVKRYGERVKYWEVWNEANSGHFIGTPAQYTEVLKVAYETIKQVDPEATVVGIAGCPGWYGFTEEVFKLGGLKYMDVLSFHDYSYGVPEVFGCDNNVARTRELMRSYGRVLPMWDTEVGSPLPPKVHGRPMTYEEYRDGLERTVAGRPPSPWFTRAVVSKSGDDFNITWGAIWPTTEDRAAKYLVRQFVLEMSEGVEKFNLHSGAAISRGKLPLLTGLSHAMMARALSTATYLRRVPAASDTTRLYLFRDTPPGKSRSVAVCWTTQDSEQAVILTSVRRVATADLFGNPGELKGDGRHMLLPLTDSPVYLFGLPEDAQLW